MARKFPLATIKRVRELREKQEQREFARRRNEAAAIDHKIDDLSLEKARTSLRVNDMRRKNFDHQTDLLYIRYIMQIEDRKARLRTDLKAALGRVDEQRAKVFEARKLRKSMDILKEHFDEDVRMEESREETKRLSEIALQRYGRTGKNG